jgi:hypothetical protein
MTLNNENKLDVKKNKKKNNIFISSHASNNINRNKTNLFVLDTVLNSIFIKVRYLERKKKRERERDKNNINK